MKKLILKTNKGIEMTVEITVISTNKAVIKFPSKITPFDFRSTANHPNENTFVFRSGRDNRVTTKNGIVDFNAYPNVFSIGYHSLDVKLLSYRLIG